ncbi:MAG: Bax inhibitor-1/YccA family protein [Bdellovibrionota bacterium]
MVVIAALNLVLDFDFIENAAYRGVPKYMEWCGAFGLLVTLVWLYLEILRLRPKVGVARAVLMQPLDLNPTWPPPPAYFFDRALSLRFSLRSDLLLFLPLAPRRFGGDKNRATLAQS